MYHAFSVELARQYGVIEAILLENLRFWIEKNRRDGRHFHDGRYWTYHTIKEFAALFPYVSERKIQYSLQKLKQQGVLLAERFNQKGYDRTLWYTFTDFGASMIQNCVKEDTDLRHAADSFTSPIPDITTDTTTVITADRGKRTAKRFTPPTREQVGAYCRERRNGVDAQRFVDYYTANGWRVGKNPMKDWKAAVRTWEKPSVPQPSHPRVDTLDGIL